MPKTESTLDIRKKEWFRRNVAPVPNQGRKKSVSTSERSNNSGNNRNASTSSGSKQHSSRTDGKVTGRPLSTQPQRFNKRNINGFTVHFSLAKAIKSIRKQEKDIYRPTITPQKIQPPPQPEKKKKPPAKKKKPAIKRFVFDHDSKSWRPEMALTNQSIPEMSLLPRSTSVASCYPSILSGFRRLSNDDDDLAAAVPERRPSTAGCLTSDAAGSKLPQYMRSRHGSESNISVSDIISMTSEGEETDTSRSETATGRELSGQEVNTPNPIMEDDESEDGERPATSIEPLFDAFNSTLQLSSPAPEMEVVKMKFLTSQGSKIMVRKRKIPPKKLPKPISDSEDTEAEREDFPGCKYLYRLAHCRAVSNPTPLQDGKQGKNKPVGVIEVYTGHEDTGRVSPSHTCPYCVVEPGKRITRWLDCTLDTKDTGSMYTKRDLEYYCQRERRSRAVRRPMGAPSGLLPIPEV